MTILRESRNSFISGTAASRTQPWEPPHRAALRQPYRDELQQVFLSPGSYVIFLKSTGKSVPSPSRTNSLQAAVSFFCQNVYLPVKQWKHDPPTAELRRYQIPTYSVIHTKPLVPSKPVHPKGASRFFLRLCSPWCTSQGVLSQGIPHMHTGAQSLLSFIVMGNLDLRALPQATVETLLKWRGTV